MVASAGVAFAAAPTVDSETSETSQETDITDTGTQTYNASTSSNISWYADSNSSKIIIRQEADGEILYEKSPDNYHHNSTSGNSYYNVSVADDGSDYEGLEADAGENVTLKVTFINDTSASSPDKTNITFTFDNGEEEAFGEYESDDAEASDDESGILGTLGLGSDSAAKGEETVGVSGDTDTVTMHVSSDDLSTALSDSIDAAESDEPAYMASTTFDGQTLFVFSDDADLPDWADDDDIAYATVNDDGDTLTIHNAGSISDSDDVEDADVDVTGNEAMGFMTSHSALTDYYEVSSTDALSMSTNALDLNGEPDWTDADE